MHRTTRLAGLVAALTLIAPLAMTTGASAGPPEEVDQSLLVPTTLDSSFAPFTCRVRASGPVCTGERHIREDWAPWDFPCHVQLYGRSVRDAWSTRYYDDDYLNYDRFVRQRDTDYLSTSPQGPATATIVNNVRFREPFAVPGDDSTFTVITQGIPWEIGPVGGPAILSVVGTLVEPPGEVGTFTGHKTYDGVTTSYVDAPLDEALPEDEFLDAVCRAATGG